MTPAVRMLHGDSTKVSKFVKLIAYSHLSDLQVLYMTGWAPHASQQQPARRGSATVSFEDLQDALKEQSDKAGTPK